MEDVLTIAGRTFHSRLFVGTGKYRSKQLMARCHAASATEMASFPMPMTLDGYRRRHDARDASVA